MKNLDIKKCIIKLKNDNTAKAEDILSKIKTYKKSNIVIKISLLRHLKIIEKMIFDKNFVISAVNFGETARTVDLQKFSIDEIAEQINLFCKKHGIRFIYSTPKILEERDFERVYQDVKKIVKKLKPYAIEFNNLNFLKRAISDIDYIEIKKEVGQGIQADEIVNFSTLKSNINAIDLSKTDNNDELFGIINKLKHTKTKRYTILGRKKISESKNCPLNDTKEKVSGLYCSAPCARGFYGIKKPLSDEIFPFITDGFCVLHLYDSQVLDLSDKINILQKIGINEFTADISSFDE